MSGVGKSGIICDVMDRQTADFIGALSLTMVDQPTLVYLAPPSFKAPGSEPASLSDTSLSCA